MRSSLLIRSLSRKPITVRSASENVRQDCTRCSEVASVSSPSTKALVILHLGDKWSPLDVRMNRKPSEVWWTADAFRKTLRCCGEFARICRLLQSAESATSEFLCRASLSPETGLNLACSNLCWRRPCQFTITFARTARTHLNWFSPSGNMTKATSAARSAIARTLNRMPFPFTQ